MKLQRIAIAVTSLALLLGSAYEPASAANRSAASSAAAASNATQSQKNIKAQVDAVALKKKNPGEIYYVYVNDKKYNPGGYAYQAFSYGLPFKNYEQYVQKAESLKPPFLQLPQAPEGFKFNSAYIGAYKPNPKTIEGQKLSKQVVAEGKASGKQVYIKKVTDKRLNVSLTYKENSSTPSGQAFLAITAEPAGTLDPTIEYVPALAEPEKLEVEGQELTYKTGDALVYKTANSPAINSSQGAHYLEWVDSRTQISYTIYLSGGDTKKEALVGVAEQIITGQ
ncbi:hypothetical protein GCM10010912_07760 [Paenibacillus albidus]|uniref:DUF4367 domain-containing protein n=1 Tax=Paenibacillus albidus TaxID=2041023 RepID=A0A917C262_9BACL|nr:hypothetical protein [Paenibacillus albidus]GGF65190.1 hypothetical protein GCM10010912_07760 [Paenibacillus albidus]